MKKGTVIKDGYYIFRAYLHLAKDGDIRMTTKDSGSYAHERKVRVNIRVPAEAYRVPDFTIDIKFNESADNSDNRRATLIEDIDDALSDFPLIVNVTPVPDTTPNTGE